MSPIQYALTLVIPLNADFLTEAFLKTIVIALNIDADVTELDPGRAIDLLFYLEDEQTIEGLSTQCEDLFKTQAIDWCLQPNQNRNKKLLISDMDSTIIGQECIDEIADRLGLKPKISAITERAMRGELAFEDALRERVGLLKGLDETDLETVLKNQINLNPGARTLVQTMAHNGAFCALVSGGFTFFTKRIGDMCGFHTNQANILEFTGGKLTGKVVPPILGAKAKREALQMFVKEQNIQIAETLAVGDGANDLDMIQAAGLGVAFYAKPIVASQTNCAINHTDLTSLLYFQAYRKEDFIPAKEKPADPVLQLT